MEIIDFNNLASFNGFDTGEDILVDTSVLLALTADYDPWHDTVLQLFNDHIFPEQSIVLLYTNPLAVNEVLHLSNRVLAKFMDRFKIEYSEDEVANKLRFIEDIVSVFLEEGVFGVLDGDKDSILQKVKLTRQLGAADASHASIANLYGVSFLTVDRKLANGMYDLSEDLNNIKKVRVPGSAPENLTVSQNLPKGDSPLPLYRDKEVDPIKFNLAMM